MSSRPLISELEPNKFVEGVFAVYNCQLGQTRAGKPYIKCLLGDKSGRTPGRMWNTTEELFAKLPTDGFVWIEGQTQPYQGQMQIIIQQMGAVEPSDSDLLNLLPCTENDIDQMFGQVTEILGSIEDPSLTALAKQYLDDEELMTKFRRAPAAMTLHHAYIGGLLEHTLSLMRLAQATCPLYPRLNPDIILTGLFLHDMGKCHELTWERGFGYTDEGHLIGHIARGVIDLQRKAEDCSALGTPIPQPLLMVLQHIILSHHGKPEYGALKMPSTPEAIAVSHMDDMDAKLQLALAAARSETDASPTELGGNFTEKIWALDTRLYRPDPTKGEAETSEDPG